MIDVENQVFSAINTVVKAQYPDAFVAGEYVATPAKFPAVSVVEIDNVMSRHTGTSSSPENTVDVTYEVNVYSDRTRGKKTECKAIAALIDAEFTRLGFVRSFLNTVQNLNDATVYRMIGRYRAVISKDLLVYRR